MAKLEARILTEPEYPQWDRLVLQSGQGTVFQSSPWITTAAKFLHAEYAIIGVFDNSDLIGGCSFYLQKVFHVLKKGVTDIPLTPYGGYVIPARNAGKVRESREFEIFSLILEKIESLDLYSVNLVNGPALKDIRNLTLRGWRERVYYAYYISLENDIISGFSRNVIKSIHKAQKKGITVKKEYNPDIYWRLTEATYRKQDMQVPFKKEYLFSLMEMLLRKNLGEMWIAQTSDGEAAAAVFNVFDSHLVYGWEGASDPAFRDTGVVSLLLYEVFRDYQNRGFTQFNVMAANTPHIAKFYSSFNPRLVPYYHVGKKSGLFPVLHRKGL
jgi:ribosomal protein S18 acetylase RimI-like enzyme